jgi:nicotinamide phosphoribosyltransferase
MKNLLLLTDSHKVTHYRQYPPNTEYIYSYFESRGGQFPATVFFSLQYFIKEYLEGVVVTEEKIVEAKDIFAKHFGDPTLFNEEGWRYILENYNGRLPIVIKAVPEGSIIPTGNILMSIENTDPNCFWLTNYLETLLVQVWYGSTVATQSFYLKRMIQKYLDQTSDNTSADFKLHDFGFRGVSSVESASIGGAAHLLNFKGTDTLAALTFLRDYYLADVVGFSIPASEHSTITAWGEGYEVDAMRNMLEQYPTGLVACVSDSFDIFSACSNLWGTILKENVLNRDGVLVVRPDSGNPVEVVLKVLDILGEKFGCTFNSKGYKVLNPKIRVIQGDGCDFETCELILSAMECEKWATENIAFGMGGALLQKLNRDTQKFTFKCSAIKKKDEIWTGVYKKPITDSSKNSKKGKLKLMKVSENYLTCLDDGFNRNNLLRPVFLNGVSLNTQSYDEIIWKGSQ